MPPTPVVTSGETLPLGGWPQTTALSRLPSSASLVSWPLLWGLPPSVSLCPSMCLCFYFFPGVRGSLSLCLHVSLNDRLSLCLCLCPSMCLCFSLFPGVSGSLCLHVSLNARLSLCLCLFHLPSSQPRLPVHLPTSLPCIPLFLSDTCIWGQIPSPTYSPFQSS